MIKKSLRLKAQLALVKEQIAAKANPVKKVDERQTSYTTPIATDAIEELGSRYAEAIVLQTAQSRHVKSLVTLKGVAYNTY